MPHPGELPVPSPEEQARSDQLATLIRRHIEDAGGALDFGRFMELALYAPGLGYYSAGQRKFGAAGDFVTAPEISPLFAQCLARQCEQILGELGGGDILEVGAGSGRLAADLLAALSTPERLPRRYLILELSADLRARQETCLRERVPALAHRVEWLSALPAHFRGVVLGNELLDAMPVERFVVTQHGPRSLAVADEGDRFVWRDQAARRVWEERVAALGLPEGYSSEVNLRAEAWVKSVAEHLDAGVLLLIDYGFPRHEFYHPDRHDGTLMCHFRHRAHGDPLILVGLQDITAHVDFTAIAEAGHDAGLSVLGYTSQAAFLLALGITEMLHETSTEKERIALAQQVKKLTLPSEMGELFKVIALGRGLTGPLSGFLLQDRRGRL
jgi:SAM-dependent MidA family methyltransferase